MLSPGARPDQPEGAERRALPGCLATCAALICRRAYAGVVAGQSTPVEPAHPPAAMLRVSNPVVRLLLRSPVGGPMRKQFMVLRFTGRKTGRRYHIPVVSHRPGGELYSLTDARSRHNFRAGADVEATLHR